jgi:hypothetical protein
MILAAVLAASLLAPATSARSTKSKKAPAPLNKGVKYEPYPGTDIAQITYKTSRKEFRVGHSPYLVVRFAVAETILINEHVTKFQWPDYKAEIKMAPGHAKPELMANPTFQGRWKALLKSHQKLLTETKARRSPTECKAIQEEFVGALEDELFLAKTVAARMFAGQDTRSRERLKEELAGRFRGRNAEWFDRLCDEFESNADLSKFYPGIVDLLIKPRMDKADELTKQVMGKVELEYATAVEEEGDITAP